MPGNSGQHRRQHGLRMRTLALLVAGVWLLILFVCIADPWPIAAASLRSPQQVAPAVTVTTTLIPTVTLAPPTATVPGGGGKPTATTTAGPTVTTTVAATATATPVDTGGGNGGGGGYQGSGPQPTRIVVVQPTAGVGAGGGIAGLSPAAFGSNGLLVATTLSCIIAILGIVIAVIALSVLIRTGYGPFLRALVLGKRAARQSASESLAAGAAGGGRAGAGGWATWDDDEDDRYGNTRGSRGGMQGRAAPVAGRSAQPPQAHVSRSRSDWR